MSDNRRTLAALGGFTLIVMALISYLALQVGGWTIGDRQSYVLLFDDATGIPEAAEVRISGIQVGAVKRLRLAPGGGAAVHVNLRPNVELRRDAQATIKAKSLLGERFIALDPGSSDDTIAPGSTITNTVTPFRVEDLGEILGPLAVDLDRRQLQRALDNVINFLAEQPAAITGVINDVEVMATIARRLLVEQEQPIRRLIHNTDRLTTRLDRMAARIEPSVVQTLDGTAAMTTRATALLAAVEDDFPGAVSDASALLADMRIFSDKLTQVDFDRFLLMAKHLLQHEGINVNMRRIRKDDLAEQVRHYKTLDPDAAAGATVATNGE